MTLRNWRGVFWPNGAYYDMCWSFPVEINAVTNNYHTYTVLNGAYYDLCSSFPLQWKIIINNDATYTVVNAAFYDPCLLVAVSSKYDH